ncbi:MAG: MFS transporter [bacterium]
MWNIIITGLTSLFTDISSEMIYPIISLYLLALGSTPEIVGLIEGIAESTASIVKVFSGAISDRVKKRKSLAIFGYAFSPIGKFFMWLANGWGFVFIGRTLDRFGKGIRTAPRDTIIAESSPSEKRGAAFGLHRAMDTLGAIIGVIIAILIMRHFGLNEGLHTTQKLRSYLPGFKAIILLSLIPAVIGVAVLFLVKETGSGEPLAHNLSLKWSKLDKRLKAFLVVTFIFTLGNSSNQFLLMRAKGIGFSVEGVLWLYLVYNLVYGIISWPAGRLSDKIGRKTLIVSGYFVYAFVYIGFGLTSTSPVMWVLFSIYGIYIAFTEGVEKALVSDIAPKDLKATLIGLHATLVGIGLFPASLLAGFIWSTLGPQFTFYFGGIMGLVAALGMLIVL